MIIVCLTHEYFWRLWPFLNGAIKKLKIKFLNKKKNKIIFFYGAIKNEIIFKCDNNSAVLSVYIELSRAKTISTLDWEGKVS